MTTPTFSIVVNTLNRADLLERTLESFQWLKYDGAFEVIVVNGPSTDGTAAVIDAWRARIRVGHCDVANLSVSRNIGICMAQGDIVAFIDDDAIPEPEWLSQLAAAYDDPAVGAAGGLVFDPSGYGFQCRYCVVDRFGTADLSPTGPTPQLCFPKSFRFPHLMGTNASFRRAALLEIGGFDEEFEYFLDETDVCLRIVDAGHLVAQLPNAYVHHKFAPSHLRDANRISRHRFPIIKNTLYFMLKHARAYAPLEGVLEQHRQLIERHRNAIRSDVQRGLVPAGDLDAFSADVERAIETGLRRGFEGQRPDARINAGKLQHWRGEFLKFRPIAQAAPLAMVLISRDFAPGHAGGIATFVRDLARALGAQGHVVHVIAASPDIDRVDFEHGAWIHRVVVRDVALSKTALELGVPQHIWNWSATAFCEARRIATHRPIDVIEAPIWDCQGIAFLLDRQWPLVTSLQTSMHFWLDSHPDLRQDAGWMASLGAPILRVEKALLMGSDAIRAISAAIRREIESAYGFTFDDRRVVVAPLGLARTRGEEDANPTRPLTVLFVGRQEHRKGIDVLLRAVPEVLKILPNVRFRLVGDNTLAGPDGITYQEAFLATERGMASLDQVEFEGLVDDDALRNAYQDCDLFVAPSRFESFGLVFLEAMRAGKPVIGCAIGGVPEIVSHGVNGLLVQPDDVSGLANAMLELLGSAELRERMGAAGKSLFENYFTADQMAQASIGIYRRSLDHWLIHKAPPHDQASR